MTTIVHGTLATEDFVLEETLDTVSGFEFECVPLVENRLSVSLPLISVRGPNCFSLESALRNDVSVEDFTMIAEFENKWLYNMEWSSHVRSSFRGILDRDAAILDACANGEGWEIRMLYPQRDNISPPSKFSQQQGLSFDIHRIKNTDNYLFAQNGLTQKQIDALRIAWKAGYFEVPRQIGLEELAEQMSISHQALSERLRRAHSTLIRETIDAANQNHPGLLQQL